MIFTFSVFLALSAQASKGAAVFAPANRISCLEVISPSELSVYESIFLPVIGFRDVTRSLAPPPSNGECSEM